MKTKVPHNVLTLSEMTKRPNRITFEVIELGDMILTEDMIKKLRASSNMFNKSTYVQVMHEGVKYNVESVDKQRTGKYKISLISTYASVTALAQPDGGVDSVKLRAF